MEPAPTTLPLHGRVAIVTGANHGIAWLCSDTARMVTGNVLRMR